MRSHFIAGWGSWKSRRIPRFLSKARSGWSYCCRLAPAVLTAAGLSAAAGDGGAAFFAGGVTAGVAAGVWAGVPAWAMGACGGALARWPAIRKRYSCWLSMAAMRSKAAIEADFIWAEPLSKNPTSRKLMTA